MQEFSLWYSAHCFENKGYTVSTDISVVQEYQLEVVTYLWVDSSEWVQMLDKARETFLKSRFYGDFQPFPQNQSLKISSQYFPTPKEMVVLQKKFCLKNGEI